jgi:hypothetical protein
LSTKRSYLNQGWIHNLKCSSYHQHFRPNHYHNCNIRIFVAQYILFYLKSQYFISL